MRGMRLFLRLVRDPSGVTAIEYAMIGSLIAVVIVAAVTTVGDKLSSTFLTLVTSI